MNRISAHLQTVCQRCPALLLPLALILGTGIPAPAGSDLLLLEDFDGAWVADPDGDPYTVPDGWDVDGICTASQEGFPGMTHFWSRYDDTLLPLPASAPYCAGAWWSDGTGGDPVSGAQDEWLISPEFSAIGAANLRLTFRSCYTMASFGAADTAHNYIKASTDWGSTWEVVADLCHDQAYYFAGASGGPGGTGWNWNEYPVLVDLGAWDDSLSLTIAFHYETDGMAPHGIWSVDDVQLSQGRSLILCGPGEGPDNVSDVHGYLPSTLEAGLSFDAYGVDKYGVNVAAGTLTGSGDQIITGAGPGAVFGPHVRGFDGEGAPLPGVSFLAYGTNRFGVNVAAGDINGDGYDEIITGAGPGEVFGPHVRGWQVDGGTSVSAMGEVSYFAYGTPKWGVNVSCGDIDGDGYDEIVTAPGPGAVYGPHIRGWNYDDDSISPIPAISYFAYGTLKYGANVCCGDVDGDGMDELITGAGPGAVFGPHVRGWNFDGEALTPIAGISFFAFSYGRYGVNVGAADLDLDGAAEILAGAGPGEDYGALVRVYSYDGALFLVSDFEAFADETITHGVNVTGGLF
jgi:hypothetical protein